MQTPVDSPVLDREDSALASASTKSPRESKTPKRYANLDILRLILASNVVVLHCFHTGRAQLLPLVATFVCLSGLLIPDSFNRSTSYGQFALKRIARVGPAMVLSLILVGVLYGWRWVGGTFLYYVTVGVVLPYATTKNAALWSLMLEELLYAGHCVVRKAKVFWNIKSIATIYAVLTITTLWLYAHPEVHFPGIEPYRLPYAFGIAATFAAGNVVCLYKDVARKLPWKVVGLVLLGAIAAWLLHWNLGNYYSVFAGQVAAVSALVFAYCSPQLRWKFPDVSYGVYVYHSPIWLLVKARGLEGLSLFFVVYPIVLAISVVSWYLVEGPVLAWKDRVVREQRRMRQNGILTGLAE